MKLEHAKHNEEVCDLLYSEHHDTYSDWVTTTAFYSALQYVNHAMFPLTIGGGTHPNFATFYRIRYPNPNKRPNKHNCTRDLVANQLPQIRGKYRRLFDLCHTARYSDYKVSTRIMEEARACLLAIKTECCKNKP